MEKYGQIGKEISAMPMVDQTKGKATKGAFPFKSVRPQAAQRNKAKVENVRSEHD